MVLQHPAAGEHVIEINPRISTRRRSGGPQPPLPRRQTGLGEISDEEPTALQVNVRPGQVLRYFDQVEWDSRRPRERRLWSDRHETGTRCPLTRIGVVHRATPDGPYPRRRPQRSRPLRVSTARSNCGRAVDRTSRRSAAAGSTPSLSWFNRYALHPEADRSLEPRQRLRPAPGRAVAGACVTPPPTDVFHFVFGRRSSRDAPVPDPRGVPGSFGDAVPRSDIRERPRSSSQAARGRAARSSAAGTRSAGCRRRR